jgi:hypothetical protein
MRSASLESTNSEHVARGAARGPIAPVAKAGGPAVRRPRERPAQCSGVVAVRKPPANLDGDARESWLRLLVSGWSVETNCRSFYGARAVNALPLAN